MAEPLPAENPRLRRRHRRFPTSQIRVDAPIAGTVLNISESGIALETSGKLMVGNSYIFRMRHGSRVLTLPGTVEWCRMTATRTEEGESALVYRAGIAFAESRSSRAWRDALSRLTSFGARQRGGAPTLVPASAAGGIAALRPAT